MRHRLAGKKLNRTKAHRAALLRNLAVALIKNKTICTTLPKCKTLRPFVEKLVTMARRNTLHTTKILMARLGNNLEEAKALVAIATSAYQDRPGGYTRIVKNGFRHGDNAPMGIVQFVGFESQPAVHQN